MTWIDVHSGVSADGEHAFAVSRRQTPLPLFGGATTAWLPRRRWRVRIWRTEPAHLLVEETVTSVAAARELLVTYSLDWQPSPHAADPRPLPGT